MVRGGHGEKGQGLEYPLTGSSRYRAGECWFPTEWPQFIVAASKVAPQINCYLPLHRRISVQGQFFYSLHSTRGEMNDETHYFERAMATCFVKPAKQQTNLQNKE